mgnify:CR=1 FL=1
MAADELPVKPSPQGAAPTLRLDKWLWCARVAKTRTQAAALVTAGKIRVNRIKTDKPAHAVRAGDVITASVGPRVRVLRVLGLAEKRGSAEVAKALFEDLTAPVVPADGGARADRVVAPAGERLPGSGRPTKRDRRLIDRLKGDA